MPAAADDGALDAPAHRRLPPGWEVRKLGEACGRSGGSIQTGPFGSQLHAADYERSGTPIITVEHLAEGRVIHDNLPRVGAKDYERLRRYRLRAGDLVFSRVGAIDRCAYVSPREDGWLFSGRCLRVRPGREGICPRFLSYLLNSHTVRRWILNNSVGSTMACLNTEILSNVPVPLPPLPEQHCIAEVLDTVDEAIQKTEALIAKLKAMRAGLLHDLFTCGLDEDGRLRDRVAHPDLFQQTLAGVFPRDWELGTAGRLFNMQLGKMLSRASKTGRHPYPYLANRNVQWDRVDLSELDEMDFTDAERAKFSLMPGDLLVCEGGEVGRTAMWRGELQNCFFQKAIHRLRPVDASILPGFMLRFMRFAADHGLLTEYTSQTSIAHLTREKLALLPVPVPSRGEQERIVGALDTHDARTSAEGAFVRKLRLIKLGLMDDLLTGRVRVRA